MHRPGFEARKNKMAPNSETSIEARSTTLPCVKVRLGLLLQSSTAHRLTLMLIARTACRTCQQGLLVYRFLQSPALTRVNLLLTMYWGLFAFKFRRQKHAFIKVAKRISINFNACHAPKPYCCGLAFWYSVNFVTTGSSSHDRFAIAYVIIGRLL